MKNQEQTEQTKDPDKLLSPKAGTATSSPADLTTSPTDKAFSAVGT